MASPEKATPPVGKHSLADRYYNPSTVGTLATRFESAWAAFPSSRFRRDVCAGLEAMPLKSRTSRIADALCDLLPDRFERASAILLDALPPPLDPTKTDDDFGDFIYAPLGEWVVRRGLDESHLDASLAMLRELTKRFTAEWSLRPFINAFPDRVFEALDHWSTDSNYHVRRLVSEGTRPRLPWGEGIRTAPDRPIRLLDRLHNDPARFVTRSVANHMNDLSKIDSGLVLETLRRWQQSCRSADRSELAWVTRHACRSLVKAGDAEALRHLGYRQPADVRIDGFAIAEREITGGDSVSMTLTLVAQSDEAVLLDYRIDFASSSGRRRSKVFKWKRLAVTAGQRIEFTKCHRFKADATTFRLFPGTHTVTLLVNGVESGADSVDLLAMSGK